jgi:hypothetical protein
MLMATTYFLSKISWHRSLHTARKRAWSTTAYLLTTVIYNRELLATFSQQDLKIKLEPQIFLNNGQKNSLPILYSGKFSGANVIKHFCL